MFLRADRGPRVQKAGPEATGATNDRREATPVPGLSELRIGLGVDAHRFADGIPLVLAGVDFPGEPGLAGHSDGDVIAHALIDAILGAAGKGDIGELFPSADPQWLDASSIRLLQRSYEVVRIAGFELVNADCVLIGERPKIARVRVAMGARLAGAMGVEIDRVTVRATTTDGLGFTGRGEGLAAQAVALLERHEGRPLRRSARSAGDPLRDLSLRTFPEYMHHNAPGAKYWGGLYETYPDFQLAFLDGDELVAELHSLPAAWDGSLEDLPPGWDDIFPRAYESGREPDALFALAISVLPERRDSGSRAWR